MWHSISEVRDDKSSVEAEREFHPRETLLHCVQNQMC